MIALVAAFSFGLVLPAAEAQDRTADLAEKPILVLNTGAHSAPVRRLVFTRDESRLLSAGDDKVVRVWDLAASSPGLAWTIRPPIWRGYAGAIRGMALTSPDAQGNQTLALGGHGIQAMRGEIGLYRFPGAADRRQGDIEAYLASGDRVPVPDSKGHMNVVNALAFSPDGTVLASASNDQTVRLWDHRNHSQIAILSAEGQAKVNTLAFTSDGRRLATGGSDGVLRIWDVTARPPVLAAQARPRVIRQGDPDGLAINALDISPDRQWVVLGREDGALFRYDLFAPDLKASEAEFATGGQQGAVEGLAIGPGGRLATSIIGRRKAKPADRPTVACDIQLRQVLDLRTVENLDTSSNLVYALAFSPGGRFLAYAGGDRQDLRIIDFRPPQRQTLDLSYPVSKGMSVWDVGWAGETSVAYSYLQPNEVPPPAYFGFDLKSRTRESYPVAQVRRAIHDYDGWAVTPVDTYRLDVSQRGVGKFTINLAAEFDGRWWDHSFLPPGPKHEKPALALACDRGVAIYRLEDGVRTRFLDGHNGAVYCLAPSPDGKWLATGSSDQTIRLWALAGSDVLAPLGAEFELRGGILSVKTVEKGSYADIAGMQAGDVVDQPALKGNRVDSAEEFLKRYTAEPPNSQIAYIGHRQNAQGAREEVRAGTTKRDRPCLSLFVGRDGEWVLWMPRGFYDSSVIGDSTFLGWQVNRYSLARPSPTDFYPILTHEKALRQPKGLANNVIDRLLTAGDESVVLGVAPPEQEPVVETARPALVTPLVGAGGAPIRGLDGRTVAVGSPLPEVFSMPPGPLVLDWKVESWAKKPPGSFEIRLEGETVRAPQPPRFDQAIGVASVPMRYDLTTAGSFNFTGISDLGSGYERKVSITAKVDGVPPKKPARARILSIAPTFADPKIRPIKASQQDVKDLAPFFARHLVTEAGGPYSLVAPGEPGLVGKDATTERVLAALDRLAKESVEQGDLLVVMIETYVLAAPPSVKVDSRLVSSDSQTSAPLATTTIPVEVIGKALESLVRRGCRVVLVLDGTHNSPGWSSESNALEWARTLRNQSDVITILATTRRPIRDEHVERHRPLARALLESIRAANSRPSDPFMTLADLNTAIFDRVQELTKRNGEPVIYLPSGIEASTTILNRKP